MAICPVMILSVSAFSANMLKLMKMINKLFFYSVINYVALIFYDDHPQV